MSMDVNFKMFYQELATFLPKSNGKQRVKWATKIIEEDINLRELAALLLSEPKVATRFLWLMSDIALLAPNKFIEQLSSIFELIESHHPSYTTAFASFWSYVGVPINDEAKAIHLLFQWLLSPKVNVTLKSRAMIALFKLSQKYPELKNELKLCLEDQLGKYSKDFDNRVGKILLQLG
jgi:hypothetical protein